MVLRMACPTRRIASDNWYYRRTIPADVLRILEKLPKERRRPRGWYKTHISITLGTPDRAAAKRKCCDVGKDGSIVFPHHGGKDTRCQARMPVFPNSHPFAHSTFTQDVTSGSRLSLFSAR